MDDFQSCKLSGIYEISNKVNGKQYIGSAVSFERRWRVHRHKLQKGVHHNQPLQNAWNRYGSDAFSFKVLLVCGVEDLVLFEQRALDVVQPAYNVCKIAGRTTGYKHTLETKAKFHLRKKAVRSAESYKAAAAKAAKTMKQTPEHKAAISAAHKGKPVSEETRAKLRAANLGKVRGPMSVEQKMKIGAANKGRAPSPRCLAAAKLVNVGKKQSEETKKKRADKIRGSTWTEARRCKFLASIARRKEGL